MSIRIECLRPAEDGWEAPTADEVREVIRLIAVAKGVDRFTGGDVARLLGLETGNEGRSRGRNVRRWTSGDQAIPYAAWCLLCYEAGYGVIWNAAEAAKVEQAASRLAEV